MNIRVKIFGVLHWDAKVHCDDSGWISVQLPEGSLVADVFESMEIPLEKGCFAILSGKIVFPDHKVTDGAGIKIFQKISGG